MAYHGSWMLLLDTLMQVHTLIDSEEHSELRVANRVQRIILDPDRSWVSTAPAENAEGEPQPGEQLDELVFRLHRAAGTLRCAGIELRGLTTRRYKLPVDQSLLALDQEQFVAYGDHPAPMQRPDELVCVAVHLASQQVALQPLSRSNTETLVGILSDGSANGLGGGALERLLRDIGRRVGNVSERAR